jgi:hypothetical protein
MIDFACHRMVTTRIDVTSMLTLDVTCLKFVNACVYSAPD